MDDDFSGEQDVYVWSGSGTLLADEVSLFLGEEEQDFLLKG